MIQPPAGKPLYHWVTFTRQPNTDAVTAACGLTTRFWPRVGIRMDDNYCEPCLEAARDTRSIPSLSDDVPEVRNPSG